MPRPLLALRVLLASALQTLALLASAGVSAASAQDTSAQVSFTESDASVQIDIGGRPLARYVFLHDQIKRPFFMDVRSPDGQRLTRNLPPVEGEDATDHPTMHPGIWLAFGDLGGVDFWRHQGVARHVEFVEPPRGGAGRGSFTVRNRYELGEKPVCEETCRVSVLVRPAGHLLLLDSTFTADGSPAFGDQEEMGLGARVATPLAVTHGGQIVNSTGGRNEREVWGQPADWCDYRGTIDGQPAGLLIMPDPRNFRRSWFHARDYGLLVANPFGQRAFTGGQPSKVEIPAGGEELRLRFGVLAHSGELDAGEAYQDYLSARDAPR